VPLASHVAWSKIATVPSGSSSRAIALATAIPPKPSSVKRRPSAVTAMAAEIGKSIVG
jgi:hypothetical protein